MGRKILMTLAALGFTAALYSFAQSQTENGPETATVQADASKEAVNVGNKICPVTGEKIDEKTKVTYEYQGKIYNFCCAGCPDEFKKDPDKYIKKVNEELQGGGQH